MMEYLTLDLRKYRGTDQALRIYGQTQTLALALAEVKGCSFKAAICHDEPSPRARQYFALAVTAQEVLNGHEMADVIDAYETARDQAVL